MIAAPVVFAYYDKNSNVLAIEGLKDSVSGDDITDLTGVTVTAQVYALDGTPIAGGPLSLAYLPDPETPGAFIWAGVLPSTFAVTLDNTYEAELTADGGVFLRGVWRLRFKVQTRRVTWDG